MPVVRSERNSSSSVRQQGFYETIPEESLRDAFSIKQVIRYESNRLKLFEMAIKTIPITPTQARAILGNHYLSVINHCRRVVPGGEYTELIRSQKWVQIPPAPPIEIINGEIVDGWQRLNAVIEAGVSQVRLPVSTDNYNFESLYRDNLDRLPIVLNDLFGIELVDLSYLKRII